ncbi:MAG: hydroxymethylglutaryl-CoA lyase [Bdellovibrionales bacterium RBG_16_40_8]|nr:MAG: hydroxymethylglutaryl-CoA lyase [Bdellovibrionales bacterium RBG_16_40_8]
MKDKIKIIEVGPRDGLQNEKKILDIQARLELIKKLADAGMKRIEVGAFVSSVWVPQMAESIELTREVLKLQAAGQFSKEIRFSCLVPNVRGMEDALKSGISEVAIFGACSETFSKKNINCSIAESFIRFRQVMEMAQYHKIKVRGYLSTAFGCPFEGRVNETRVVRLVRAMVKLGVFEVSIGDTIGVATPKQVESLLKKLRRMVNLNKIAMHFHDTRGTSLANVYASYNLGIRAFDSSVGGLGGCPYAKGASGNLATEDLVYMLKGMGIFLNIDIEKLIQIKKWAEEKLERELPSRVGKAGLPEKSTY